MKFKNIFLITVFAVLTACATQLKIGENDVSISLLEVDTVAGVTPGARIEADGCVMIIRNADKLTEVKSLEAINMKTDDCSFGKEAVTE